VPFVGADALAAVLVPFVGADAFAAVLVLVSFDDVVRLTLVCVLCVRASAAGTDWFRRVGFSDRNRAMFVESSGDSGLLLEGSSVAGLLELLSSPRVAGGSLDGSA
jgi:hypothetical protein